ncbi:helix-turn-helix domain-containing protein [Paenibacillus dokdonensis]|uniref:helix-turn-helix domain-containing protein n=1 Tax=Paenibacillus dokdonensis TaxID=2567944 RepID=UPI0010A7F0D6|nr:helix-turn-helix transcriptional regulator [Paenibacillus dokdonensis]
MYLQIKLKQILKERKITQNELSKLANVTQSKISNLCNNNMKELNISILERIAAALDIKDISELIQFEGEKEDGENKA